MAVLAVKQMSLEPLASLQYLLATGCFVLYTQSHRVEYQSHY